MIQYAYTILYVEDVSASILFYEKAFGFQRKFVTPENDYGEISTGSTTIAFVSIELANTNLKNGFIQSQKEGQPFGIELGLVSEQVEAAIEQAVQAGAEMVEELVVKPWGQKVAYLKDNNGFLIEMCTPIKK